MEHPKVEELERQRDDLYAKLEVGYAQIEEGLRKGEEVKTWEEYWVELLRDYEEVCRALQRDLTV